MKKYLLRLVSSLSTCTYAYRLVYTAQFKQEDSPLKSKVGECVAYLNTGCAVAESIPIIGNMVSMVSAVGKCYLNQ